MTSKVRVGSLSASKEYAEHKKYLLRISIRNFLVWSKAPDEVIKDFDDLCHDTKAGEQSLIDIHS